MRIPKKHKQCRQNHPYPDIKENQANNGVEQAEEFPGKGQAVKGHKQEEDNQDEAKVDQRLYIAGEQEQVLGDIDLGKDPGH